VPGGVHGAVLLDAGAIAMFLDGVLGGHGDDVPVLNPQGLSAPQAALITGLAVGIARAFSDALVGTLGVRFESRAVSADDGLSESTPIACVLEFGSEERIGRVALLLPKEVLLPAADDSDVLPTGGADPRVVGVLEGVEIELVAELGRTHLRVADLGALRVGDTLRLDVPVSGTVTVRAREHVLLRGRPTTSGGRIAIEIAAPSRDH
jgi:flagellar motor switch protein FliM